MIEGYVLRTNLTITKNEFMKSGKPMQTATMPYQVITITFFIYYVHETWCGWNEILCNKKCQRDPNLSR